MLQKQEGHWALESLKILQAYDIGWAKQIDEVLHLWNLEKDWDKIAKKSKGEWKVEVEKAAEKANIERLKSDCFTKERGDCRPKTKTKTILQYLDNPDYKRKPLEVMNYGSVLVTRAVIMGHYGMLNCKANFSSGSRNKACNMCSVLDDENHRINDCIKYKETNFYELGEKIDFSQIYSNNLANVIKVVEVILKLWDLGYGKNMMRQKPN